MNAARLRSYAGLAAAIVPCAIIVHLIAEAAAVGRDGLGVPFIVRHAYFGVLFLGAAVWFAATAGVGRSAGERRRRCALLAADFRGRRGPLGVATLATANLAFFSLTQVVEGVPVASGSTVLCLAVALSGSVIAALAVFFFGNAMLAATLDAVIGRTPRRSRRRASLHRARRIAAPRHARVTYSLLRPNRPPPFHPNF